MADNSDNDEITGSNDDTALAGGGAVAAEVDKGNTLLLGLDLGTSRTAVMSSRNGKQLIRSVVGYPRDLIGLKLLGKPYAVGQEALDNRSFLDMWFPLEDGVLREYGDRDLEVARHLITHIIESVTSGSGEDKVCAIIGVPARTSAANRARLLKVARDSVDLALVVSEPFMVAYGQSRLVNTLVIDIGAGTIDICALKGSIPGAEDQATIARAGNFVDERLQTLIREAYPDVQINQAAACAIKEKYSFVGEPPETIVVELRANGRPGEFDVTEQIRGACEALIPDIIENVELLVQAAAPEDQAVMLRNIVVAGGGSEIRGIDRRIAEGLSDYGEVVVTCVEGAIYAGAAGALKLAQELPPKYWDELGETTGAMGHGHA